MKLTSYGDCYMATLLSLMTATGAASTPDNIILLPLTRIQNQTQYGSEFYVGTPPQRNVLITDTGSSEAPGFENKSSTACQQNRCDEYGTYNNLTSSTAVFVSDGYGAPVGPDPYGVYINDTLSFGGRSFTNFTFGTADTFDRPQVGFNGPQATFLGLSNYCNLTVSPPTCTEVDNLLEQLHTRKVIDKRFFSLYLGPNDANATGHVLFNGIDKAKQASQPFTVPMAPPSDLGYQSNHVNVSTIALSLVASNGSINSTVQPADNGPVIVDSGTHDLSLDSDMAQQLLDFFNIKTALDSSPHDVDCKYRQADPANAITLSFNGGNDSVSVPVSVLVDEFAPGQCATDIVGFGFASISAGLLRGLYATYDLDNLGMTFSEAKHTNEQDVEQA